MPDQQAMTKKEKLLAQRDALNARIKREDMKERQMARKADTRRKVIVGAVVLQHMEFDENFREYMDTLLQKGVTRKIDRDFLGLDAKKAERSQAPTLKEEVTKAAAE